MKKVTIKNKLGVAGWGAEMEDPTAWIAECVAGNYWGLPERWVLHKDEPMAEAYDDADVLEEEMRELTPAVEAVLDDQGVEVSPAVPAVMQKWVKLKAEYTVSIIDLSQDPEWLLQECHRKRLQEYPSLGEFADAFVKMQNGDPLQMEAYVAACMAVKAKYPKP
jgi:hypothetical protein